MFCGSTGAEPRESVAHGNLPEPTVRRRWRMTTSALLLVGSVAVSTSPARAAPPAAPPSSTPRVVGTSPDGRELPYLADPRLDPDLGGVSVDTPEFRRALERYRATERNRETAKATFATSVTHLADLRAAEARLVGLLNQSTRRKEKSDARLVTLNDTIERIAVNDYIRGDSASAIDLDLDVDASTEFRRRRVVLRTVRGRQLAEASENRTVVDQMSAVILSTQVELDDVRARVTSTTATRDRAVTDEQRFEAQLVPDAKSLADSRMTGDVPGLDFSIVVLDAYVKAAKRMGLDNRSCGISWTLIAGISRTEGRHGTYGGSSVDADGNQTKPILGIALDGENNTAVVTDTDGGKFDGDVTTDRAVGPMQFIPSTWTRWGRDGNNDDVIDPQNMYDATLAAAAYLCYFGPGLATDDGIRKAVIHYNVSNEYVEIVLARAKAYDEVSLPSAPKVSSS